MLAPADAAGGGSRKETSRARTEAISRAGRAIGEEAWDEAERWLLRALDEGPASAALLADLAFVLTRRGRHAEAIPRFEEAIRLGSHEGETLIEAARAALAAGLPPERAEAWLLEAIDRNPSLVVDAEAPAFDALRGRPHVALGVARAWRRVSGAPGADG